MPRSNGVLGSISSCPKSLFVPWAGVLKSGQVLPVCASVLLLQALGGRPAWLGSLRLHCHTVGAACRGCKAGQPGAAGHTEARGGSPDGSQRRERWWDAGVGRGRHQHSEPVQVSAKTATRQAPAAGCCSSWRRPALDYWPAYRDTGTLKEMPLVAGTGILRVQVYCCRSAVVTPASLCGVSLSSLFPAASTGQAGWQCGCTQQTPLRCRETGNIRAAAKQYKKLASLAGQPKSAPLTRRVSLSTVSNTSFSVKSDMSSETKKGQDDIGQPEGFLHLFQSANAQAVSLLKQMQDHHAWLGHAQQAQTNLADDIEACIVSIAQSSVSSS